MKITRRNVLQHSGIAALGLHAVSAHADGAPIRIGSLAAMTGPTSATGVAQSRGVAFALDEINAAGGVRGRMIEVIARDTQSDPTKAVNGAVELTRGQKVDVIWGPGNSGEALAATPTIARAGVPQLDPCWVDQVMDVTKYPYAFRVGPTNQQVGTAAVRYAIAILKQRQIAQISDTSGYGTSSLVAYAPIIEKMGGKIVYQASIDAGQTDLKPDLLRMQAAGAKVIMPWSNNAGLLSRILNTRANLGWDVPVVGQAALGSGQTRALLDKLANWENVFQNSFRSVSYGNDGKLPPRSEAFTAKLRAAKIDMSDTLLWWIANGYDAVRLVADAFTHSDGTAKGIAGYWNGLKQYPGVFGTYSFTPELHDGYPEDEVVMAQANSFQDGTFKLAPGYG